MNKFFSRLATAAASLLLAGTAAAQTPLKFSLNFKPDGSNAAWFLAAERGFFKEAGLDVTLDASGGTGDVLSRLGAGAYDAGFADIGALVEFAARNPQQAPVAVLVVYARSPLSLVSLRKSGIARPGDVAGRTVGAPAVDGAVRMFPTFVKATGVDAAKVSMKTVDIRMRETLLVRGDVDAVLGFDSTVWFNLKALGVQQDDVNIIRYADHGLDLYGNALMVSRKLLRENPAAVQGLVRATLRGWREAMADPKAAIAAVAKRDPLIDQGIEIDKLRWLATNQVTTPMTRAEGFGAVDRARLERQIDTIATAFSLPGRPTVDAIYDPAFLPPAAQRMLP